VKTNTQFFGKLKEPHEKVRRAAVWPPLQYILWGPYEWSKPPRPGGTGLPCHGTAWHTTIIHIGTKRNCWTASWINHYIWPCRDWYAQCCCAEACGVAKVLG